MLGRAGPRSRREHGDAASRLGSGRGAADVAPGSRIGRYVVREPIGRGGMGAVYLGHDPIIGREVAIKVIALRPDLLEERAHEYRERLLREAQSASTLDHPNIVAVHDTGEENSMGFPYIVMEYVPGWDLAKAMESLSPLPARAAVRIAVKVAAALDYAHGNGVVHRDVKPTNILIGDDGAIKIADFGFARVPGFDLTLDDHSVGSPPYISPEQIKGGEVDGRSDLFALGVILYRMLTGRLPFYGVDIAETLHRIAHDPAPPASSIRAGLAPGFDTFLERALAKDPDGRYQSGQEMVEALLAVVVGAPDADERALGRLEPECLRAPEGATSFMSVRAPWWDLSSSLRLGEVVAIFLLLFIILTWSIHALIRSTYGIEEDRALSPRAGQIEMPASVVTTMATLDGQKTPRPLPGAGRITFDLNQRLEAGTLKVMVDGREVLSESFQGPAGGDAGRATQSLEIPAGQREIDVSFVSAAGLVDARSMISATIISGQDLTIEVDRGESNDSLELTLNLPAK